MPPLMKPEIGSAPGAPPERVGKLVRETPIVSYVVRLWNRSFEAANQTKDLTPPNPDQVAQTPQFKDQDAEMVAAEVDRREAVHGALDDNAEVLAAIERKEYDQQSGVYTDSRGQKKSFKSSVRGFYYGLRGTAHADGWDEKFSTLVSQAKESLDKLGKRITVRVAGKSYGLSGWQQELRAKIMAERGIDLETYNALSEPQKDALLFATESKVAEEAWTKSLTEQAAAEYGIASEKAVDEIELARAIRERVVSEKQDKLWEIHRAEAIRENPDWEKEVSTTSRTTVSRDHLDSVKAREKAEEEFWQISWKKKVKERAMTKLGLNDEAEFDKRPGGQNELREAEREIQEEILDKKAAGWKSGAIKEAGFTEEIFNDNQKLVTVTLARIAGEAFTKLVETDELLQAQAKDWAIAKGQATVDDYDRLEPEQKKQFLRDYWQELEKQSAVSLAIATHKPVDPNTFDFEGLPAGEKQQFLNQAKEELRTEKIRQVEYNLDFSEKPIVEPEKLKALESEMTTVLRTNAIALIDLIKSQGKHPHPLLIRAFLESVQALGSRAPNEGVRRYQRQQAIMHLYSALDRYAVEQKIVDPRFLADDGTFTGLQSMIEKLSESPFGTEAVDHLFDSVFSGTKGGVPPEVSGLLTGGNLGNAMRICQEAYQAADGKDLRAGLKRVIRSENDAPVIAILEKYADQFQQIFTNLSGEREGINATTVAELLYGGRPSIDQVDSIEEINSHFKTRTGLDALTKMAGPTLLFFVIGAPLIHGTAKSAEEDATGHATPSPTPA